MRTALAVVAMCVAVARPLSAQGVSGWEVFAAYAFVNDPGEQVTFPTGWAAGAARRLNDWLSVVADVGSSSRTVPLIGGDVHVTTTSLMVGGRAAARIGSVTEFGEVLAGPVHARGSGFGQTDAATHFGPYAAAGIDVPLHASVSGRAEFGVRFLGTGRQVRVLGAVVYRP